MERKTRLIPNHMKFVFGGASGMAATCVVQPFDLIKSRMQKTGMANAYKNSFHCFTTVLANEGIFALYKGFRGTLYRQTTYTAARLGVFAYLNEAYRTKWNSEPHLLMRMGMGLCAGAFGTIIGMPTEVVLIRMAADGSIPGTIRLPVPETRDYKGSFNTMMKIIREEGAIALWRGYWTTKRRAMVVAMAQLASYSQAKSQLIRKFQFKDGIQLQFLASMISGLITTIAAMPVNIAKTRIRMMKYSNGEPKCNGRIYVLLKVSKRKGFFTLRKGFRPCFCGFGLHTVLTFIFLEQMTRLYYKHILGVTDCVSCL